MDTKVLSGLLNPIRMKILQIFLLNDTATARNIAEELPDIPPATLYRHINKLAADGIIAICEEKKIRGTVEKVYKLKSNPLLEINELIKKGSSQELFNVFYTFTMTLLSDFRNYLDTQEYDLEKDRVAFRSYPLYLSDEECDRFFQELKASLLKIQDNKINKQRKLRKLSLIMLPENLSSEIKTEEEK